MDTAERYSRAKLRVVDVFGTTRSFYRSHQCTIDELKRLVYETPLYRRLPAYLRGRLDGVIEAQFDELHQHMLYQTYSRSYEAFVFCDTIQGNEWTELDLGEGRFVWRNRPERVWY